MDTNTLDTTRTSESGLDTVRKRAQKQSRVSLPRAGAKGYRISMDGIKSLKSKAFDEDYLQPNLLDARLIDKMWDWFQRAIGNR